MGLNCPHYYSANLIIQFFFPTLPHVPPEGAMKPLSALTYYHHQRAASSRS